MKLKMNEMHLIGMKGRTEQMTTELNYIEPHKEKERRRK